MLETPAGEGRGQSLTGSSTGVVLQAGILVSTPDQAELMCTCNHQQHHPGRGPPRLSFQLDEGCEAMKWIWHFLTRTEKAQSLVEFALVLPALVLLVFGALEFGRVTQTLLVVSNAAREGARYAAVGFSEGEIRQKVEEAAPSLDPEELVVEVTNAEGPTGTPVTVEVTYNVQLFTLLSQEIFGQQSFPVSSRAVMSLE